MVAPVARACEVHVKIALTCSEKCLTLFVMPDVMKCEHGCETRLSLTWAYRVRPARPGHQPIRLG
jgi:hypothetical protein